MTIKHSEIAASRPSAFEIWFSDIHYDGHAILIVIFDQSVEGIDSIAFDDSIGSLYESH